MLNKECSNKIWTHFLLKFCNILETRPNSDQIKTSIVVQIPPLLSAGSILWFWWHAWFSALANSGHAQKPFFTSNEPNIFALPPPDVDLHAGFIWQNAILDIGGRRCHQGDICTPERGPIPQSTNPPPNHLSQYNISLLSQYGQKVTKNVPDYHLHYQKSPVWQLHLRSLDP